MKVMLLTDLNSVHSRKWIKGLSDEGVEVFAFGIAAPADDYYVSLNNVSIAHGGERVSKSFSVVEKFSYLNVRKSLKQAYNEFRPDIVHAHYASSYGLLGSFLKHKPYFISIWGTDVFVFPKKSILNKVVLKRNLRKATDLCSTSYDMAREASKYTDKKFSVIPFGVDLNVFKPNFKEANSSVHLAIVKTLLPVYGIQYLLPAFRQLIDRNENRDFKLSVVGEGDQKNELLQLVNELKLEGHVSFRGFIPNNELPEFYKDVDVAVIPSLRESFGVSAVEALACQKAVIASKVGGLPEIVKDQETGLLVEPAKVDELYNAMQLLTDDADLRKNLAARGRMLVEQEFDWKKNVAEMIGLYSASLG